MSLTYDSPDIKHRVPPAHKPAVIEAVAPTPSGWKWSRLAAVGLVGTLLIDHQVGRRLCKSMPSIASFDAAPEAPDDTAVLVTAGFNSKPEATALPLLNVFTQCGRLALLLDSGCKFSLEANYQAVSTWTKEHDIKNLVMYGPSMGSMLNVAIAPRLKEELDVNLFMLLDSSPYCYDDVKGGGRRSTLKILSAAHRSHYTGGPMMRLFLETLGYNIDNWGSERNPIKGLAHAFKKARDPEIPSNAQCLGRASHIRGADLDRYMKQLQDVPFAYIGPEALENDSVVNNDTAFERYQARHDAPIPRITHPEAGHANPGTHPEASSYMVKQALSSFGLLPARI